MSKPKTPDTKTIRAWIDNNSFYDLIDEEDIAERVFDAVDSSYLLTDIQDKIHDLIDDAYEDGQSDVELLIEDLPEVMKDEIGCAFVVNRFASCVTLEDFKREYDYIYSEYLTFMK